MSKNLYTDKKEKKSKTKPEKNRKKKQKYFVNCIDCDFLTSAVDDLPSQPEWISDSQLNVKHGTTWRTLSFAPKGVSNHQILIAAALVFCFWDRGNGRSERRWFCAR
jgi:hypothetical protein